MSQRSSRLPSKATANGRQICRPLEISALERWYVSKRSGAPSGARMRV